METELNQNEAPGVEPEVSAFVMRFVDGVVEAVHLPEPDKVSPTLLLLSLRNVANGLEQRILDMLVGNDSLLQDRINHVQGNVQENVQGNAQAEDPSNG